MHHLTSRLNYKQIIVVVRKRLWQDFFLNFIKSFCSEIGEIGFPLPIVDGIEVINAEVVAGQVKYFLACSKY